MAHSEETAASATDQGQETETLAFLARHGGAQGDFFRALALYLAGALDADYICIDRLDGDEFMARTVAVWSDGKFEDNVTYALRETPCGELVGRDVCCYPAEVRHRFPHDQALQDLVAESYAGVTLWGDSDRPIGLIAVIGRRPLADTRRAEAVLRLVAVRAGAELERLFAEERVLEREQQLRQIIDLLPHFVFAKDEAGKFILANQAVAEAYGTTVTGLIGKTDADFARSEEEVRHFREYDLRVIRSGLPVRIPEETITDATGRVRVLSTQKIPFAVAGSAAPALLGVSVDITDRKRAEEALVRKIEEVERFNRLTVDRELAMIALKKEINALLQRSGAEPKYRIVE